MLSVRDDGSGMEKEMLDKVFEPFFTTKGIGKGTGLGLATVYGIAKQNDGFVDVFSEPGKGSTFQVYLPRQADAAEPVQPFFNAQLPEGCGETILIVEDEAAIMELGKIILEELGYRVIQAPVPTEALRLAREHRNDLQLLITDVIMPEMNGRQLADRIKDYCPRLKTLFMSGYTANVIARRGVIEEGVCFMAKPFSKSDIAFKVREALDLGERGSP